MSYVHLTCQALKIILRCPRQVASVPITIWKSLAQGSQSSTAVPVNPDSLMHFMCCTVQVGRESREQQETSIGRGSGLRRSRPCFWPPASEGERSPRIAQKAWPRPWPRRLAQHRAVRVPVVLLSGLDLEFCFLLPVSGVSVMPRKVLLDSSTSKGTRRAMLLD